jgi:RNA polymerase sigma-70 factor (sigma-E family)
MASPTAASSVVGTTTRRPSASGSGAAPVVVPVPAPRRPVRTYASRHRTGRRAAVLSADSGGSVQGGGAPERLRGVQDVVPHVDTPFESTSVRVDASRLTFADFYRATFTDMTRLALLLTGSGETARDLVQDSFVRLHGKWNRVDDPRAYLRRTVVNACHSHHRRLHVQRLRRHLAATRVDVVDLDADEMVDAIAALPYRQRAAIVLRFWHDSSEADIAATLGCRPGTVGSLIHRALAELRKGMP